MKSYSYYQIKVRKKLIKLYTTMTICLSSIAPIQLGKFHCVSNPLAFSLQKSSVISGKTFSFNTFQIALQVSDIIFETVLILTQKANEIDDILFPDAKYRKHISRRIEADIGVLTTCCFSIFGPIRHNNS